MTTNVVHRTDPGERLSRARRELDKGAFLAEAADEGFAPSTSVQVAFEPAQDFAEVLGIGPDDEMCVRDRVQRAGGSPVQLAVSRLPRSLTRGTVLEQPDTGPGGMYARIEEQGRTITHFEETVSGGLSFGHERALLGEDIRVVLRVRRIAWTGDQVVEVNDMVMPAENYQLRCLFLAT